MILVPWMTGFLLHIAGSVTILVNSGLFYSTHDPNHIDARNRLNYEKMKVSKLILVTVVVASRAGACLWDYDTLAMEAKGLPDVVQVVTGRFDRNPPLYYEMRLARVAAELKTQPEKLNLYDDAGVACDRLSRDDEAIAWMAKKRTQLRTPEKGDDWYRYYANLGTFYAHRWFRSGADRKKTQDLKKGIDCIDNAITINPEAHFGREKYQLAAMKWVLMPTLPGQGTWPNDPLDLPNYIMLSIRDTSDAVQGLAGLVVLGNAWQSIDVFEAMAFFLSIDKQDNVLGLFVLERTKELLQQGQKNMFEGVSSKLDRERDLILSEPKGESPSHIADEFHRLRLEAEVHQKARLAYMMPRLQSGRHPDTDPEFWKDFKDAPPPIIQDLDRKAVTNWVAWVGWGSLGLAALAIAMQIRRQLAIRKFRAWEIPAPGDGPQTDPDQ